MCTLFDSNYLLQGLTLIESVSLNSSEPIDWLVLALDHETYESLINLHDSRFSVISLDSFPDSELQELRSTRAWREFCWTCASALLNYAIQSKSGYNLIGYVDADCYFLDNIVDIFSFLPENKNFAIHEHRFSTDRIKWLESSGRFNVGVIVGRPETEFADCIALWRRQVIISCELDPGNGKCGDQTYLNDWPNLYKSLHIFEQIGVGLAPWNLNNYNLSENLGQILVDNEKVYFFHFHGLVIRRIPLLGFFYIPASGYDLGYTPISEIYAPYLTLLTQTAEKYSLYLPWKSSFNNVAWLIKNFIRGKLRKVKT